MNKKSYLLSYNYKHITSIFLHKNNFRINSLYYSISHFFNSNLEDLIKSYGLFNYHNIDYKLSKL